MADYATWGEAVGRGLGWGPGSFLSTYTDNRKEATLTDLLDSPLGKVLLQVARLFRGLSGTLRGTSRQAHGNRREEGRRIGRLAKDHRESSAMSCAGWPPNFACTA